MSGHPIIFFLFFCAFLANCVSSFSFGRWGKPEKGINEENLKENFLAKLGLNRVPNVTRAKTSEKEMEEMTAIYERSLKDDEVSATDTSDFQRLYTFKDKAPETGKRDIYLLSFPLDIGNIDRGLLLHSAKLHVYKRQRSRRDNSATIELYQLLESSMLNSPQSLLIESRKVAFDADEWEVFDVTKAVATWLEKPSLNHGFSVKCKDCTRKKFILVTADTEKDSSNRALLDVSVVDSASRLKKRSNPFITDSEEEVMNDCIKGGEDDNNLCCRYSLWVSFKDMGWDWIVKPEGYHAYYCKGECPYDYVNYAHTHALLQSIYNSKYDKTIPPPCCVPKSLESLSLLHYSDSDPPQLVVSRQTGMVAKNCGCA